MFYLCFSISISVEIKVSDIVQVLDENLSGKIVSIRGEHVTIECNDGFEYTYLKSQLIKLNEDNTVEFEPKKPPVFKTEATEIEDFSLSPSINFSGKVPLFDLHLEELAAGKQFENDHEALLFQLSFAQEVIYRARAQRVRRLIFIHGYGKGKLRSELRRMLKDMDSSIEFWDGDYSKFGGGATEVIIHRF
jgi:dsDNA-specific endonuclease/ATPase MutS2